MKNQNNNLKDIKNKTIKGLLWSANSKFLSQLFNFIITAILARLLIPADFGIVGMSLIFTGLIAMINETGLTTAIIQKKDITNSHLYTAFWVNIATGIILFVGSFFAAPLIADFFKAADVELIIKISSISFLISSVALVNRSLLTKNLNFKKLAATEIIGSIVSGVAAIYLAFLGFGFWSLVARNLINDFVVISLTLIAYPWKPAIYFSKKCFIEMFSFGANVIGSSFLYYLRGNLDYIVVGRLMGTEMLGYYTLAYSLAIYPIRKLSPIITKVVFPAFSIIKDDNVAYKNGYIKLLSFMAITIIPAMVGLASISNELIRIIYGYNWILAIQPLQILCIVGIVGILAPVTAPVFYSKGVPEIDFKLSLIKLPITAIALIIGSSFGINGIASTMAIVTLLFYIITQKIINSLIELSWKEYLSAISVPLLSSLLMGIIVTIYKQFILNFDDYFILASSIIIGILIYILTLNKYNRKMNQKLFQDILQYKNLKGHQK